MLSNKIVLLKFSHSTVISYVYISGLSSQDNHPDYIPVEASRKYYAGFVFVDQILSSFSLGQWLNWVYVL